MRRASARSKPSSSRASWPRTRSAYLGISGALARGSFGPKLREALALLSAGTNGCDYCASAHGFIASSLKVEGAEIDRNLAGSSADPSTAAILAFAGRVLETRGRVSEADLAAVRAAGASDGEIAETWPTSPSTSSPTISTMWP
ncbi:MAG TPA: carboxymuconolactone decarboxylase family protein [Paracoccaceae bacterium]|nr:carboxymuconolactone decarboxylase family protein [Paracoccaceae bacterium]